MARRTAFVALAVLCLAGAQARMLQQDLSAYAPGANYVPPPPPPGKLDPKLLDPKTITDPSKSGGKTLSDLTGLPGLPPIGTFIFPNGTTCQNSGIGNIGCNNDGNFNLGFGNSGAFNKGNVNNGNFNDASGNNGDFNTGDANAGDFNSGGQNNGDKNTGSQNNGNGNSGNQNEGTDNSGNRNLGIANAGDTNNGNFNYGNTNFGTGNNGSYNQGDGNLGDNNVGNFNTASGQTGSYISPDGTVNLYPIKLPAQAPLNTDVAQAPTLSQVLAEKFGGTTNSRVVPITSTTSLGALVTSIAGRK